MEQLKEAKGVDSVTDYVEEKENVDVSKAHESVSNLVSSNVSANASSR